MPDGSPCFRSDVTPPARDTALRDDAQHRRIRRTWWFLAATFFLLGLLVALRFGASGARPIDLAMLGLVAVVGYAAILHRDAVHALELGRRAEAESLTRIVQGLSRSLSPDAVVEAIVDELGASTRADHVVVVRRRRGRSVLDATLVSTREGVPSSTTLFPLADLEDPLALRSRRRQVRLPAGQQELPLLDSGLRGADEGRGRWLARIATVTDWLADLRPRDPKRDGSARSDWARPRVIADRPAAGSIAGRIADRVRTVYGLKHTLAAPLTDRDGTVVGAIVLSRRTTAPWPPSAERVLAAAATEASAALTRATSHRDAEARASTDALTGLPNRRYFDEYCRLLARRRRTGDGVGVLMIDVDRFKTVNDTFGHDVGDAVLRAVASAIVRAVRDEDVPCRFGGEEFAVLVRNASTSTAVEVAERVRAAVAAVDLDAVGVPPISVSVGVAVARRADQPIAEVIADADRALYEAKRGGRDRVSAA